MRGPSRCPHRVQTLQRPGADASPFLWSVSNTRMGRCPRPWLSCGSRSRQPTVPEVRLLLQLWVAANWFSCRVGAVMPCSRKTTGAQSHSGQGRGWGGGRVRRPGRRAEPPTGGPEVWVPHSWGPVSSREPVLREHSEALPRPRPVATLRAGDMACLYHH